MARYRFLAAVYADRLYQPGEIADMPASFVPSAACEPLDAQATAVFFAIDPAPPPLVRQHWSDALLQTYPTTF